MYTGEVCRVLCAGGHVVGTLTSVLTPTTARLGLVWIFFFLWGSGLLEYNLQNAQFLLFEYMVLWVLSSGHKCVATTAVQPSGGRPGVRPSHHPSSKPGFTCEFGGASVSTFVHTALRPSKPCHTPRVAPTSPACIAT